MPNFRDYPASQITKMLLLGHTGAGKTGALCSLAAAGYNVRLLDLDKGAEIIKDFLINPKSIYTRANPGHWTAEQAAAVLDRFSYVEIDESVSVKGPNLIARGDAWQKITTQLGAWKDGTSDFGNVSNWGPEDILVIDGLSRLSRAALNYIRAMEGKMLAPLEQSHYFKSQNLVEGILELLYSSAVNTNIIMICHIAYGEMPGSQLTRGFPQTIGKAIGPKVGQYFNHALRVKASGQGSLEKRMILTNTSDMIELKSAAPLRVKAEYPIETGLADYFADVRAR